MTRGSAPTHNAGGIFNIDIVGGFPAAVHAMLLGSTVGELKLPANIPLLTLFVLASRQLLSGIMAGAVKG